MGLYTPTILGGNSYLSWFHARGAIKGPAHTRTSKGLSQAMNRGEIRKFMPKYANVYVNFQSHDFSAGARTHYVTANEVRNGLPAHVCRGRRGNHSLHEHHYFIPLLHSSLIQGAFTPPVGTYSYAYREQC